MPTVLLVVLIVVLLAVLPTWPYSTGWGYYPSGGLGLVVLIVIILLVGTNIGYSGVVMARRRRAMTIPG
jgi:hypothetical protein